MKFIGKLGIICIFIGNFINFQMFLLPDNLLSEATAVILKISKTTLCSIGCDIFYVNFKTAVYRYIDCFISPKGNNRIQVEAFNILVHLKQVTK